MADPLTVEVDVAATIAAHVDDLRTVFPIVTSFVTAVV